MKKITSFLVVLLMIAGAPLFAQTISGHLVVCLGASRTTLSISTSGGAWSSGDATRATIDASTGEVTGVAAGTATMSYTILPATVFTAVVTVNAITMNPIGVSSGGGSLCTGGSPVTCSITPVWGNAWSSSNTAIATVNTGGLVTPTTTVGTAIITYHHGYGNCDVTRVVSVNPTPTVSITSPMCNASAQTATAIPTGGTWVSSNASVATINSTTGDMNSLIGGSTYIYYTSADGCLKLTFLSVSNLPGAISGTLTTCLGNTTTLSSTTTGGVWSSGNPAVATVGAGTGIVSPVSAGTSVITYTPGAGCLRTAIVTVNAALSANTGSPLVCIGQTTTLSNATTGGTWSSSATAKATVGYYTGVVTGVSAGTANITYRVGSGCMVVTEVTVNSAPAAIMGTTTLCVGTTTTLSHVVSGGTWSCSNTAIATVDATSGVVTGVSLGGATITYTISAGCYKTITIGVTNPPAAIGGVSSVCVGSSTTLTDATSGGSWSSSNTGIATIVAGTGVVSGVAAGTATITYMASSGCYATRTQTIATTPTGISGSGMCVASTQTFTSTPGGGTWTSSAPAVAAIGPASGIVTGLSGGGSIISYTLSTGCRSTMYIAVANLPGAITGSLVTCMSNTTTLNSTTSGGIWTSGSLSVATIGAGTGIVSPVSAGTSVITYTAGTGCERTAVVTINAALSSNTGDPLVCIGQTTTLSNATSGGTWSSSATSKATVGYSTGVVTAVSAGTANITYSVSAGCTTITQVTVNPAPATITGTTNVCVGETITLSHAVSGGTWSSSNSATASIDVSTGIVTGIAPGAATITYTISSGCYKTLTIIVRPLPATISGTMSLCTGAGAILTNATSGGTWSSSNTSVATIGATNGLVIAVSSGTTIITYRVTSTGCFTIRIQSVNPLPDAGILSGPSTVSVGASIALSSTVSGGSWSSSNPAIATVSSTGDVTGINSGTVNITYSVSNICGTASATQAVTVYIPVAPITGTLTVCTGTTTTLSNTTPGGTWSSSNAGVATVSAGTVTGVAPGTATISYTIGGTSATAVVTVNPSPNAGTITGASSVDIGATITLSDAAGGGVWSSSNTAIATVGTSGIVTGVTPGTVTISYSVTNSCGTATATRVVTVNVPVAPITGTLNICPSATTTLNNATSGGTWSSSNTSVASIGSGTGIVTGITPGTTTISYTTATGFATAVLTVIATSAGSISGPAIVPLDGTVTLSSSVSGGTWSSSSPSIATVGTGGIVSGIVEGTATIYYTVTSVCTTGVATRVVTVSVISLSSTCTPQWMELNGNPGVNESLMSARPDITVGDCGDAYVALVESVGQIKVKKYDGKQYNILGGLVDSATESYSISVTTDHSGTPFVAYEDVHFGRKVTVKKYNGSSWEAVGTPGFTAGATGIVKLKIDTGGKPWVAYRDSSAGGNLTVMKYTGSAWTNVGSTGFSEMPVSIVSLDIDHGGTPFVCYTSGSIAIVRKFTGSTWDTVANAITGTSYSVMVLDTMGTPYVVSAMSSMFMSVVKLDDTAWIDVGPAVNYGVSTPAIAIGPDNLPCIAYRSTPPSSVPHVRKFDGYSWVVWGVFEHWLNDGYGYAFAINSVGIGYLTFYYLSGDKGYEVVARCATNKWELLNGTQRVASLGFNSSVKLDRFGVPHMLYIDYIHSWPRLKKYVKEDWIPVGEAVTFFPGTVDVNYWRAGHTTLAFDSANLPYVAFARHSYLISGVGVRKFNGTNWELVGPSIFNDSGYTSRIDLAINPAGTPYIISESYYPYAMGYGYSGCYVSKFNGTNWENIWNTEFLLYHCYDPCLKFDSAGMLYASFLFNGNRGMVWKYDGTSWTQLGGTFCTPVLTATRMKMVVTPGGTPYVVFSDPDYTNRASVKKFDGSAWVYVGTPGFSSAATSASSITLDHNGLLSVVMNDLSLDSRATIMRFDGTSWQTIGPAGFSEVIPTASNQYMSIAVDTSGTTYATYSPATLYGPIVVKFESPTEIYGDTAICQGASYAIRNHGGGNWSSNNTTVATVSCTGLVTGVGGGVAIITYTYDTCYSTAVVTVNATPDPGIITGPSIMALGSTATFLSSVSGGSWGAAGYAVWVSSSGLGTAWNYGNGAITYTVLSGGCSATAFHGVLVNATGTKPVGDRLIDPVFTIAPNPTQGNLRVTTDVSGTLSLYSLTGQRLEQYAVPAGSAIVSMPRNAPPGIYLMRFQGNDGTSQVARVSYQP